MNAAQRVFDMYELAELILLPLPLYDLLLATTISQSFREVVMSSTSVRRRLENEAIPVFACFQPGDRSTEDLCNLNKGTPWFFRTNVSLGSVLALSIVNLSIELYIPHDERDAVLMLDSKCTTVWMPLRKTHARIGADIDFLGRISQQCLSM